MARSVSFENGRGTRREGGFTLIEVMFALVYLTIGLLAIAAMQDISIARNGDARRLSSATNLAVEMLERIRFNSPVNATATAGQFPYHNLVACNYACTAAQVLATCNNVCTTGTVAPGNATQNPTSLGDYNQWSARLSATDPTGNLLLPNAIGTVTSAATGPVSLGQVQVTVTVRVRATAVLPATVTMNTIVAPL